MSDVPNIAPEEIKLELSKNKDHDENDLPGKTNKKEEKQTDEDGGLTNDASKATGQDEEASTEHPIESVENKINNPQPTEKININEKTSDITATVQENLTISNKNHLQEYIGLNEENKNATRNENDQRIDSNRTKVKKNNGNEIPDGENNITTEANITKLENVLSNTKETGFVLTSAFDKQTKVEDKLDKPSNEDNKKEFIAQESHLSTTTPKLQSVSVTKTAQSATYITELPSHDSNDKEKSKNETKEMKKNNLTENEHTSNLNYENKKQKKSKNSVKRQKSKLLQHLGLSQPPDQYSLKLQPLPPESDPNNPVPVNPDIYITHVPKQGGVVKTPFYVHVDFPKNCLQGETRIKFEKQDFEKMNLNYEDGVKLCSNIVDISTKPQSYVLKRDATIKMRVLDQCATNEFEELTIITNSNFSWSRLPTKIVSNVVNDEKHYYATTDVQCLGKFAVVSTYRIDRFVITRAGGLFLSTVDKNVGLSVDENLLKKFNPQLIEMRVKNVRDYAIQQLRQKMGKIKGVSGRLIAASPVLEISKEVMGMTGKMNRGVGFPKTVKARIPVPLPAKMETKHALRSIKIMKKADKKLQKRRHKPDAFGETMGEYWEDITNDNRMAAEGTTGQIAENIDFNITIPGKYLLLNFEQFESSAAGDNDDDITYELSDLCEELVRCNDIYEVKFMVHQKISKPEIFSLHLVTSEAVELIHNTMSKTGDWKKVYMSEVLNLSEWQPVKCEVRGQLRLTVNQVVPNTRFYSQRWQGYQIQLESSENTYSETPGNLHGSIAMCLEDEHKGTRVDMCVANVVIPNENGRPYKPTVIKKTIPKVTIFYEYKLKWLNNLSPEEKERYMKKNAL